MSDNEYDVHLWLRIERGGEIAAFRELFDRYYAPLCRFAEFWLRDRASAEEVVLDVYTHVWQHAAELRITVSFPLSSLFRFTFHTLFQVKNCRGNQRMAALIEVIVLPIICNIGLRCFVMPDSKAISDLSQHLELIFIQLLKMGFFVAHSFNHLVCRVLFIQLRRIVCFQSLKRIPQFFNCNLFISIPVIIFCVRNKFF